MSLSTKRRLVAGITLSRFVLAAIVILCAFQQLWAIALVCTAIGFLTDWIDGKLARYWHVVSSFGKFFDPLSDKALCLTVLWIAAIHYRSPVLLTCATLISLYDLTTTSLRLIVKRGRGTMIGASHIAKLKTATLMSGLLILLASILLGTIIGPFSASTRFAGTFLIVIATLLALRSLWQYVTGAFSRTAPTPIEQHSGITAIDFGKWHTDYGINYLLCDIEGTLTSWGDSEVSPAVHEAIQKARMAGIRKIGLITNIKQSSDGEARVRKVAATIHADVYYQPRTAGERKPSPLLLKRAFKELGVKSHEAAFIGDKYVDVLAGSRAHVGRIAWVKRLGTTDHLADRLLYRPIEPLLKWLI